MNACILPAGKFMLRALPRCNVLDNCISPSQNEKNSVTGCRYYSSEPPLRQKLVILGSGWGGFHILRGVNKMKYDVTLVTPRNHFLFTPLLPSTAVGTLELQSIIEPVHSVEHNTMIGKGVSIDMENKIVKCKSRHGKKVLERDLLYDLKYDKLLIAVGSLNNTFGCPGVTDHAFFLKEIHHSKAIKDKILTNFELALEPGISKEERERLLHIVIVGAGPTGVEFGAELYDFVSQDVPRHYRGEEGIIQVTIVEAGRVLTFFDEKLRVHAEKVMKSRKRFNLVKNRVIEVHKDRVKLADGQILPCGVVVWSTGLSQVAMIKNWEIPKTKEGRILVNDYLQLIGDKSGSVYAIGDCASCVNFPLPCTAQVAERQAAYLSKALNDMAKGNSVESFTFKNKGMMAYLGGHVGLADLPGHKLQGFESFVLWRLTYLIKLVSWRQRFYVLGDWMRTALFGRSVTN